MGRITRFGAEANFLLLFAADSLQSRPGGLPGGPMQSISLQRLSRCSWFFLFLASTLPATGCIAAAVTAGVAGTGAAGYITWQAAVPQDFPADIDVTWAVTQQASPSSA